MNATTYTRHTAPKGYYAIVWPGNGKTYFFRVTIGRKGSAWEGRRFITKQAGDEQHRMSADGQAAAWALILADTTAAMRLYGERIGSCGKCHRTLTDETSRAYGIGPECRKKYGL